MKKLTLLFSSALLALTISSFADKNTDAPPVLVKTITNIDAGTNSSIVLTYNGNKIVTAGNDVFTYTGDLITKVETSDGKNKSSVEYTYDASGKLLTETVKDNGGRRATLRLSVKYTYTYNPDGTVTAKEQEYPDGVTAKGGESIKFTIANGNVVREERFDIKGASADLTVYEYDTKNTIYKNVLGADKLIVAQNFGDNNVNNIIKTTLTNGSGQSATKTVITNVYTYSAQGYPQSVVSTEVTTSGTDAPETTVSNTIYGY